MTADDVTSSQKRTSAVLHGAAEQLEVAESRLHRSAEASPDPEQRDRLHALGDQVTAEADGIDRRADGLSRSGNPGPAAG